MQDIYEKFGNSEIICIRECGHKFVIFWNLKGTYASAKNCFFFSKEILGYKPSTKSIPTINSVIHRAQFHVLDSLKV